MEILFAPLIINLLLFYLISQQLRLFAVFALNWSGPSFMDSSGSKHYKNIYILFELSISRIRSKILKYLSKLERIICARFIYYYYY